MDEILNLTPSQMAGASFDCSCGKRHEVVIRKMVMGRNAVHQLPEIISEFGNGEVLVVADSNTKKVFGEKAAKSLADEGFRTRLFVYEGQCALVPDERAVGRLLTETGKDTSLILAVGSGTLNDLARYISSRTGIPYVIVCTAPSMDGYASVVSPLIIEGFKKTFEAVYPYAIVADLDILKTSPPDMVKAGFGDIIGKMTALADWDLSRRLNGEYYCKTSVQLVRNALDKCISNAAGMMKYEDEAILSLTEALIFSGIAIGLVGNSRPASGAEHHLAHYWEMEALSHGKEHPLHGNSVGVGSVVVAMLYQFMKDWLPDGFDVPDPSYIKNLLESAGACSSPASLGIDRVVFRNSIIHAMKIRPRYTVFHLIKDKGLLEKFADELTDGFYGKMKV